MKALALVLLTGCSFVLTKGPDTGEPPRAYPSCTTSMTWPVVDGILSAVFLTSMITAITQDDQMSNLDEGEANKASKITSAALLTGVAAVSAYVGYRRVSRCRSAQERFMSTNPGGMQPYGYPYGYQQQPYYPPQQYPQPQYTQPQPQVQPPQPAPPIPQQQPAASALGTEGDVCASSAECATGLSCANNVCIRPPADTKR